MTIKSPVSWMGNKTSILHILYSLFPLNYGRYIEPFGGSGAVLLGKPVPDKFEVYNDYNANLVNLFRCMRDRPLEFIRELGFLNLNARDDFAVLKQFFRHEEFTDTFLRHELELTNILLPEPQAAELRELYRKPKEDYDLRRAVMFLKLIRYSYSSGGKSFACQPFNIASLFTLIEQLAKRLANAVIENQDFEVLIRHYDRTDAFIYCDPPYYTSEYVYECGFTWEDHLRLKTPSRKQKANGLYPITTARKSGICIGTTINSALPVFTAWCRNMRRARNSPNCLSATMTFTNGNGKAQGSLRCLKWKTN